MVKIGGKFPSAFWRMRVFFFIYPRMLEATVGKLLAEIKNRITFDAVDRSTKNIMRRQDC